MKTNFKFWPKLSILIFLHSTLTLACCQNSSLLIFFISTSALVFSYTVPCVSRGRGGKEGLFGHKNSQENSVCRCVMFCVSWVCLQPSKNIKIDFGYKELLFAPRLRVLPLGFSGGSGPDSPPPPSRWSAAARWQMGRCRPDCWRWWWPPPPEVRERKRGWCCDYLLTVGDTINQLKQVQTEKWMKSIQF